MWDESQLDTGANVSSKISVSALTTMESLRPRMDQIFAQVESSLPSIDFDVSSDASSDSEEPMIFNRKVDATLLGDNDKDLDTADLDPDDDDFIDYDKNRHPSTLVISNIANSNSMNSWLSDNSISEREGNQFHDHAEVIDNSNTAFVKTDSYANEADLLDLHDNKESTVLSDFTNKLPRCNRSRSLDTDINTYCSESSKNNKNSLNELPLSKKCNAGSQTKSCQKDKRIPGKQSYIPLSAPVLSGADVFKNVDFDNISTSLSGDCASTNGDATWLSGIDDYSHDFRSRSQEGAASGDSGHTGSLIQRLAQLSGQYSEDDYGEINTATGALNFLTASRSNVNLDNDRQESRIGVKTQTVTTTTSSAGTNTDDLPKSPVKTEMILRKTPETVFIDLRGFDKVRQEQQQSIERVQRILGINKPLERENSDDDEDDDKAWQEQRRQMKEKSKLSAKGITCNAKSLPIKSKGETSVHKTPSRVIPLSKPKQSVAQGTSTSVSAVCAEDEHSIEHTTDDGSDESSKIPVSGAKFNKEQLEKAEAMKKLREERENERRTRLNLKQELDSQRCTVCIGGGQGAAEHTDVIFDLDVSYEPAPLTLPSTLSSHQECLLLTIRLSANGRVMMHRENKVIDNAPGMSGTYFTMITWFLSLVPDNRATEEASTSSKSGSGNSVSGACTNHCPFNVIGIQQLWLNEELKLYVAVVPSAEFQTKPWKLRSKEASKGRSLFMQSISKFLASNTLQSVSPWLSDLISMEIVSVPSESDVNYVIDDSIRHVEAFLYTPSMPHIASKLLSTFVQVTPDVHAAERIFTIPPDYYWQTLDTRDPFQDMTLHDEDVSYSTQTTMSLLYRNLYRDPRAMMGVLNRLLQEGLDLAGIRLLYITPDLMSLPATKSSLPACRFDMDSTSSDDMADISPVLAMAVRGAFARTVWLDSVGPSDPILARRTDPNSLCALYGGGSRDECWLFCPRNPNRVHTEITRWFGGRATCNKRENPVSIKKNDGCRSNLKNQNSANGDSCDSRDKNQPQITKHICRSYSYSDDIADDMEIETVLSKQEPVTSLIARTLSDLFLLVSPLFPPKALGLIFVMCQRRGYRICGIKRLKITAKKAGSLGIAPELRDIFSCDGVIQKQRNHDYPCTALLVRKENGVQNSASLVEAFMIQLCLQGLICSIQSRCSAALSHLHIFHIMPFTNSASSALGGEFSKSPDYTFEASPRYVQSTVHTDNEMEQIAVLLMTGHDRLKSSGPLIGQLMGKTNTSQTQVPHPGFELLSVKWLPALTLSQAREITPYEIGDRRWRAGIQLLMSEPALILAVRSVGAYQQLETILKSNVPSIKGQCDLTAWNQNNKMAFSKTPEQAFKLLSMFFFEKDMWRDNTSRPLFSFLPESYLTEDQEPHHEQILKPFFDLVQAEPDPITTFLLIKPPAVSKYLAKILKKVIQEGFKIVAMRLSILSVEDAEFLISEHKAEEFTEKDEEIDHMTSGPSLVLCVQRVNAVKKLLDLIGPKNPQLSCQQSQFLWRGIYGTSLVSNAFDASCDYSCSVLEIRHFFPDGLSCEETDLTHIHRYTCPANDTMIDDKRNRTISVDIQPTVSSLMQTSCIVLMPPLIKTASKGRQLPFVEIIESLLTHGFELVGARMLWLSQTQAEQLLHITRTGSYEQVSVLTSSASIVLALERDNAVVSFDHLLSSHVQTSVMTKYGGSIIKPADVKMSHNLLTFFFDKLEDSSQIRITAL